MTQTIQSKKWGPTGTSSTTCCRTSTTAGWRRARSSAAARSGSGLFGPSGWIGQRRLLEHGGACGGGLATGVGGSGRDRRGREHERRGADEAVPEAGRQRNRWRDVRGQQVVGVRGRDRG